MLPTMTIFLMTSPSRESAFYLRRRDDEDYDRVFSRYRDILTWIHYETPPDRLARYCVREALAFSTA